MTICARLSKCGGRTPDLPLPNQRADRRVYPCPAGRLLLENMLDVKGILPPHVFLMHAHNRHSIWSKTHLLYVSQPQESYRKCARGVTKFSLQMRISLSARKDGDQITIQKGNGNEDMRRLLHNLWYQKGWNRNRAIMVKMFCHKHWPCPRPMVWTMQTVFHMRVQVVKNAGGWWRGCNADDIMLCNTDGDREDMFTDDIDVV